MTLLRLKVNNLSTNNMQFKSIKILIKLIIEFLQQINMNTIKQKIKIFQLIAKIIIELLNLKILRILIQHNAKEKKQNKMRINKKILFKKIRALGNNQGLFIQVILKCKIIKSQIITIHQIINQKMKNN